MKTASWLILAALGALIWYGTASSAPSSESPRALQIGGATCTETPASTDSRTLATGVTFMWTLGRLNYPAARWTISSTPNVGCGGLSIDGCTGTGCTDCVNGQFTYDFNSTTPSSGRDFEVTALTATTVLVKFYPCGGAIGSQNQCTALNSVTCADATHTKTCILNGTGPQLIWSAPAACPTGAECASGQCLTVPTTCYVCQGEQAAAVPFSSATNATGTSCEGHMTAVGQTMHTYQPRCVAGQPARDPAYFQPKVVGFRVKAHDVQGRSTGDWSHEFAPGTPVPDTYVKTWRTRPVDVLIHIRNDGAQTYASGDYYAGQGPFTAWLNQALAGVTHLRTMPGIGTAYDFTELAAAGFDAQRLSSINQAYIDAVPWLQIGIVEIAFYGNDAAPYAYGDYYAARSASRAAWLPLVGEDTSHDIDPCFPNQGPGGDGFVNQFRTLISSPINGGCQPYDSTSGDEGGACDLLIAGKIKLPVNETYLDPHQVVPVWDRNGKYWLSGAVFDRCDAAGAPTTYLDVGGSPFDLRTLTLGAEVCCGIRRYSAWGWTSLYDYFVYDYYPRTQIQCASIPGSKILASNATTWWGAPRCDSTDVGAGHCYRCDTTGTVRLLDGRHTLLEDCRSPQALAAGWTTDLTQALSSCPQVDLMNMCEMCDANAPVEYLPANTACTDGWYRTDEEIQRYCQETCNGVVCEGETKECLDNAVCVDEDPVGVQCGGPCLPEERCLRHPTRGWTCHPVARPPQRVPCYRCTGAPPHYEDIGAANYPRLLSGESPANATDSCRRASALPWVTVSVEHRCDSDINFPYSTITNPADNTKFCMQLPKKSATESCSVWTAPRKPGLDLTNLDTIDDIKIEAAKIDMPAGGFWDRIISVLTVGVAGDNLHTWYARILAMPEAVCVPDYGDAQCANASRCVRALNSPHPENHKNKVIYDALKPKILSGWQTFWLKAATEEKIIENHGVCLNDRQLSWWDRLKRWLAGLFGLDPDDPAVTWIMVAIGVSGALLLYQYFLKPKHAPNILPYPIAPPSFRLPRRPAQRLPQPRLPTRRRPSR